MTPELKFILHLSKTKPSDFDISELKNILKNPLDWERILQLSKFHRVAGLVYNNISHNDFLKKSIPENLFLEFKSYYYSTLKKNILLWQEFLQIIDIFEKRRIEIVPLKGIILGDILYKDIALRSIYSDIDILVKEQTLPAASIILKEIGYTALPKKIYDYNIKFRKSCLVEMHWMLGVPWLNKINMDDLWLRSKRCLINNKNMRILSDEDLLWPMLTQIRPRGIKSFSLFRICDIHELITQKGSCLDWNYILKTAKNYNLSNVLCFALSLCQRFLFTSIPQKVMKSFLKNGFKKKLLLSFPENILVRTLFIEPYHKRNKLCIFLLKILLTENLITMFKILTYKLKLYIHYVDEKPPVLLPAKIPANTQNR